MSAYADFVGATRGLEVGVLVLYCAIVALVLRSLLLVVTIRIVDEALLLEEVFPPGIPLLGVILAKGIVLDIDLALGTATKVTPDMVAKLLRGGLVLH